MYYIKEKYLDRNTYTYTVKYKDMCKDIKL